MRSPLQLNNLPPEMKKLAIEAGLTRKLIEVYEGFQDALARAETLFTGAIEASSRAQQELSRVYQLPRGPKGDRGERGPQGLPGRPGADGYTPDVNEIVRRVVSQLKMPKDGKDADEEKIIRAVKKELIKEIKEGNVIEWRDFKGLEGELSSYRHQMAMRQAGQRGGGTTVSEGTNITLVPLPNGTVQINATGGSSTPLTPTGDVDASNTVFGVASEPTSVVADGITYFNGFGYIYDGNTSEITTDIPPSQFIRYYA